MPSWNLKPRRRSQNSHQCGRCDKLIAWLVEPGVRILDLAEVADTKGVFRLGTVHSLRISTCGWTSSSLKFTIGSSSVQALRMKMSSARCMPHLMTSFAAQLSETWRAFVALGPSKWYSGPRLTTMSRWSCPNYGCVSWPMMLLSKVWPTAVC